MEARTARYLFWLSVVLLLGSIVLWACTDHDIPVAEQSGTVAENETADLPSAAPTSVLVDGQPGDPEVAEDGAATEDAGSGGDRVGVLSEDGSVWVRELVGSEGGLGELVRAFRPTDSRLPAVDLAAS